MPKSNLTNYLHLHFIVFIWGFTAVLGKLITLDAVTLVWLRLIIASVILFLYLIILKTSFKATIKDLLRFCFGGVVIGLHWLTFFYAIKIANISITLATLATGALFVSIMEPIFFKRRIRVYEIVLASLTVIGIAIIFNVEGRYSYGIIIALISAFLSALFSVVNAIYVKQYDAKVLSLYELFFAALTISAFVLFQTDVVDKIINLNWENWLYIFILGSVCTAYAVTASTYLLKKISPFTMMLTINLEPVYGILLALLVFGDSEKMHSHFYFGAILIFVTVIINGVIKTKEK